MIGMIPDFGNFVNAVDEVLRLDLDDLRLEKVFHTTIVVSYCPRNADDFVRLHACTLLSVASLSN